MVFLKLLVIQLLLTFQNSADESIYKITKGYVFDNRYCFSITSDLKDVSMTALNIIVKNRNGVVILNSSEVLLLTLNKYFPYDPAKQIPLPNRFDFTTEKTKVIVLNQLTDEYFNTYLSNVKEIDEKRVEFLKYNDDAKLYKNMKTILVNISNSIESANK